MPNKILKKTHLRSLQKMGSDNEHIVMLPFMAIGHLIPFLALARQIQRRTNFKITIANTPLNIKYLDSLEPNNLHFAELPFSTPADSGLPSNTENSENLPLDQIGKFCEATTSLETPFRDLLIDITAKEGKPPVCVISDFVFGWANGVAKSVGTVNLCFSTCGAYGSLAYFSMWMNLPQRKADSDEFRVPGFPESYRFHVTQLHQFIRIADGTDVWSKFMQPQIALSLQSAGLLCNTVEEIEPLGLDLLRSYIKIPVWSVGPLLPPEILNSSSEKPSCLSSHRVGKEPGMSTERCLDWLDLNKPCSVVYVSFGSQNSISPAQMMELALGLEKSGKAFIWVIRPPIGFDRKAEFRSEWLPEGFEERISSNKQGLLVRNWAPQLEILSHGSIGAFVSHCGWNSVMESLSQGVPMIGWPLAAEQAYNCKMLVEEMGVSVELGRGLESKISWEEVKKVVEMVMDENGKGGDMRKKAMEFGKMIRESVKEKGSFGRALDDLVRMLLSMRF
ncbi:UDP-glycosyltransferase 92A1-like [Euphorbia lathyris]|uniref:UDP-glycosyltransferase 92A1-like n=1 Tax=Euphorbia lathyris TaxID=212925 RepID=UPI0033140BAB